MQIILLTPWSIISPMIFLYLWIVKHEYTIYNSLFQTNEQYNTHVSFVLDQTKFRENEQQVVTVYHNRQKGWYPEAIIFCDQLISGIISLYQYIASTENVDNRNIVTDFSSDTEQYKLGTRHGLFNSTFSRNEFMSSTFRGLSEAEVYLHTAISVCEAVVKTGCARKTCKCFMYFNVPQQ